MANEIKYMHAGMTGAPTNPTNTPGSLIAILDACLVNGFGTGTVDSIVVANNLATVTRAAGHPFEVDVIVLISGSTPTGLNGEKKVLSVTTTTYTFDATGISNGTATGTITHKVAPAGWQKAFSGTNLAAYKSIDVTSTGSYLRIDDTPSNYANVRGFVSMTDINTGLGQFPTSAQTAAYNWTRCYTGGPADWVFIGDAKRFFLIIQTTGSNDYRHNLFFGDILNYKSGDTYHCGITAATNTSAQVSTAPENSAAWSLGFVGRSDMFYLARNATGVGAASPTYRYTNSAAVASQSARLSGSSGATYPNTADNSILLSRLFIFDQSPYNLRGMIPGLYIVDQNVLTSFTNKQTVEGIIGLPGRKLKTLAHSVSVSFIDITGPWE